jgi:Alternate to MurJ
MFGDLPSWVFNICASAAGMVQAVFHEGVERHILYIIKPDCFCWDNLYGTNSFICCDYRKCNTVPFFRYAPTALMSSGIINGVATILLTLFIVPKASVLADRVMNNQ